MAKNRRKQTQRKEQIRHDQARQQAAMKEPQKRKIQPNRNPLEPWTERQADYLNAIATNQLVFGIGPAGTGKTYMAVGHIAELVKQGLIENIIFTRPAVEAGESLGFLPGELDEKFDPYIRPLYEALEDRLGTGLVEYMKGAGQIEMIPLAYMRGLTFSNTAVIMTEAQNTTPKQMKLFLTRIGDARVIVEGDTTQKDIKGRSGLDDALARLEGVRGVEAVEFTADDCVRSGLVREVLRRYENDNHESDDSDEDGTDEEGRTRGPWEKWTHERYSAA